MMLEKGDVVEHEKYGRAVIKGFAERVRAISYTTEHPHIDHGEQRSYPHHDYFVEFAVKESGNPIAIKKPQTPMDEFMSGVTRKVKHGE